MTAGDQLSEPLPRARGAVYTATTAVMVGVAVGLSWAAATYVRCWRTANPHEAGECLAGVWMFGLLALLVAAWAAYRIVVIVQGIRGGRDAS